MGEACVFVVNCGSSSIKFQVIQPESGSLILKGLAENVQSDRCQLNWTDGEKKLEQSDYPSVLEEIVSLVRPFEADLIAVGHRVVHGGEFFSESVLIDENVLTKIKACHHLAPLHNPVNALGIEILQEKFPQLPQVAVFDTAFHHSLPKHAYLYALPYTYYQKYQIRRYGFHGTSHRFVVQEAAQRLEKSLESLALISAHLGNGCSVTAVLEGKSVETSMGMTPLEGLVMGRRSGDLDPSLVGYLAEKLQLNANEVTEILNKKSGLFGISGVSEDMRLIEAEARGGNTRAQLAIEVFCYRLAKYIAAYLVPLKRLDALIFTGGIGENATYVRSGVVGWLEVLGLQIDRLRNENHGKEYKGVISPTDKAPLVMVVPTNEELLIAKDSKAVIEKRGKR